MEDDVLRPGCSGLVRRGNNNIVWAHIEFLPAIRFEKGCSILLCGLQKIHEKLLPNGQSLHGRNLKPKSFRNSVGELGDGQVIYYTPRAMAKKTDTPNYKVIAENRRARYDYAIESDIECGIQLTGSEVKSLRTGQSNIADSYAAVEDGELWLINSYIAPYAQAKTWGHEERRRRKLLVSRKELSKLWQATSRQGMTLVPMVMYFNHKGMVKVKIGVAKGKKNQDKRATEQKRDWQRQKQRLLRQNS
jgi:SsrA-binding protein